MPLHDRLAGGTVEVARSATLFDADFVRFSICIDLDADGDGAAVIVAKGRNRIFGSDAVQNAGLMVANRGLVMGPFISVVWLVSATLAASEGIADAGRARRALGLGMSVMLPDRLPGALSGPEFSMTASSSALK